MRINCRRNFDKIFINSVLQSVKGSDVEQLNAHRKQRQKLRGLKACGVNSSGVHKHSITLAHRTQAAGVVPSVITVL